MTRREEIEQQAESYTLAVFDELDDFSDVTQAYIDGAEWMQETMIEEACKYLKNALYEVASGVTNSFDIMSIENTTMDDFISSFRKVMEE